MVNDQIPQFASLLRQIYLFSGFNDLQMAHVVSLFKPLILDTGKVVFLEGTPGENFYIIFKGKVKLTVQEENEERLLGILGPGEYFGEEALIYHRLRSATATTLEPTTLLTLDSKTFYQLMEQYPQIEHTLKVTAESRYLARRADFDWLGDDEVIYLVTRKHEIFLWRNLLLPIFLGLACIPVLSFGLSGQGSVFFHRLTLLGGVGGLILAVIWGIWSVVDWSNDYYVITNQRVRKIEKVILLYTSSREAPLTHILAVNVARTWFGRVIGYGDVDVRTFTGGIRMPRSTKPDLFASYVEGYKARATYVLRQAEIESMRRALQERMGVPTENGAPPPVLIKPNYRRRTRKESNPGSFRFFLETLFNVRYEQKDVITYRKYWPLLFAKVWLPTVLIGLLVLFTFYQLRLYYLGTGGFFASFVMFLVYGMTFLCLFAWWIYNYLDWSNDIYQLAPDQIRDIERKPLGDELKKTAPLESILSLEHTRDGILQIILNYGNVILNVGQTHFVFRGVFNPDQVHQDVSDYIEALNRRKRELEAARERERMLNWLMTFKDEAERAEALENEMNWKIFPG